MDIGFRKAVYLFLAIASMFVFVPSCKQAPTAQPWERQMDEVMEIHPMPEGNTSEVDDIENTTKQGDNQKTYETRPTSVSLEHIPVDNVKESTPAHLKETLKMKGCTVSIDADVLVRTREPQSCPIYRVEPFKYDPEAIAKLVYGEEIDEAMAYDKTVEKAPERPNMHYFRSGNVHVVVDDHFMGMGNYFPRYAAVVEEEQKNAKEVEVLPSGICDAISFSREEAIEKARTYLEPFQFPVDLDLPRVKACQWHGFQYYEIIFEHLYGGIPSYTNTLAANIPQLVLTFEYVSVQVCQEGVLSMDSYLSQKTGIEAEYRHVIDFDTAYGLFKEYMYDRLAQAPMEEIFITEIEFAYFPVLPKDYDGSYWMMVPCWIFCYPSSNYSIVINGLDGSLILV
jgi:hypothetical protein